jgi:hypothetical protein
MTDNGKGDTPRPMTIDLREFAKKWNATFGNTLEVVDVDGEHQALVFTPAPSNDA